MPPVHVNGKTYRVVQHSGYLSADVRGFCGWTAVWGDDYKQLVRRIRQIHENGHR